MKAACAAIAAAAAMCLGGCDWFESAEATVSAPDADAQVAPADILDAYRPCLATVAVTWRERRSVLGGYRTYGHEGVGVVIAGDGRRALLLTSRRLVDPAYRRDDGRTRRDVAFRVEFPHKGGPGAGPNARLVAIYTNGADLALLRIPSPLDRPFSIPLAGPDAPRVGDELAIVGPPVTYGLTVATGTANNYWQDGHLGVAAFQIRLDDGPPVTAGGVFTRRGGRLVGILRGQESTPAGQPGDLFALSTDMLRRQDFWTYLIEEHETRELLSTIQ